MLSWYRRWLVVVDENRDLRFEIAGQELIFQQGAVFEGLMPALDFTLIRFYPNYKSHRMPAPADHLVGLPQLVGGNGLVIERIGRLDDDDGRAGDQVARLQQAVD